MKKIDTRQYISIFLVTIFGILALGEFFYQKKINEQFETLVQMAISFYLGRATTNIGKKEP